MLNILIITSWFLININKLSYPIFSTEELQYVPTIIIKNLYPDHLWLLRLIAIITFGILLTIITRKLKLHPLSTLVLFTSPWTFILAREYNPLIIGSLLVLFFIFIYEVSWKSLLATMFFCFYLWFSQSLNFIGVINHLKQIEPYVSLIHPFFNTVQGQNYLNLPKVGYFLYPSFILFFIGVYAKNLSKLFFLIIFSLILFLLFPSNNFIFAGIGFIFIISILVVSGAEIVSKNKFLTVIFIILSIINFIFFLEVYFWHYQKKFGEERRITELNLVTNLMNKNIDQVYINPNNNFDIWYKTYSYHYELPKVNKILYANEWVDIGSKCFMPSVVCVLEKDQLSLFSIDENSPLLQKMPLPNGLIRYYVL